MSTWDDYIFTTEANASFLDDLSALDDDQDIIEAVRDAIVAAAAGQASEDESDNALAAATIAAIWAGAPFSAGDVVDNYPFIRSLAGHVDEELNEQALALLEEVDKDVDLEPFTEALS